MAVESLDLMWEFPHFTTKNNTLNYTFSLGSQGRGINVQHFYPYHTL